MPRFVRPFWIKVKIDGEEKFASGPRSLSGNIEIELSVRDKGEVKKLLDIDCFAIDDEASVDIIWANDLEDMDFQHFSTLMD